MKKAFPFKKRLSAVLAAVLAVAGAAGATPASAQDKTYAYSVIGDYGSFEEYIWSIGDDTNKAYELSFATVDGESGVPVVTKTGADGNSPFATLNTRQILLTAGAKYQVSFKIKSADANTKGWFKLMGIKYTADSAQSNEIKYSKVAINGNNAAEASLSDAWSDCTAEFTADASYPLSEFRIWIQGNKGTQITVKDFDVREIKAQAKYNEAATLDGWDYSYTNPDLSYNNPGSDDCKIEPVAEGYNGDYGALKFHKEIGGKELRICQKISDSVMKNYADGTVFVFEAYVKCDSTNRESLFVSVEDSNYSFTDTNLTYWNINDGTTYGWKKITNEIKKYGNGDLLLRIKTGGWLLTDFYVDNIKLYAKDDTTKTNLLSNGDFRQNKPATTLEGWKRNEIYDPRLPNVYYNPGYDDFKIELVDDGCNSKGAVRFLKQGSYFFEDQSAKSARIVNFVDAETMSKFDEGTKFVFKADFKGSITADPFKVAFDGSEGTFTWNDTEGLNYHDLTNDSSKWVSKEYEFTMTKKGLMFFVIRTGGYSLADLYIDNVQIYAENDPDKTNLISNSTFCETETVISEESAVNSEFNVTNIPGFDIGMLSNSAAKTAAVPSGSYDGSTALKIAANGIEGYFQTNGENGITLVRGDCGIKASGYFNKLSGDDAAYAKVWMYLYNDDGTYDNVSTHYTESDRYLSSEKYDTVTADGWRKFEVTLNEETTKKANDKDEKVLSKALSEYKSIKYLCGIKAFDWETGTKYYGEALFDDVKFEIISKYAPGDSNGDGDIDIRDLVHMKKYAAGTVKFTDMTRGTWLSDIGYNESPSITNEMVCMRKYLIGASSEYGK